METNLATNSNRRVLSRKLGGADPSGTIWTSGFRRLAEVEAMLHARARARSSSHSFCMVFSVNLEIRPILPLISLSLLAVVQVLVVATGRYTYCSYVLAAGVRRLASF